MQKLSYELFRAELNSGFLFLMFLAIISEAQVDKVTHKGRFIAFEGPDGSGKTTQLKFLASQLRSENIPVYETCEPTRGPIGSLIRQIMTGKINCSHEAIGGLFVADRLEHLLDKENGIYKKVKEGIIVLCDRYYFSSYAYQGVNISLEWLIQANSLCANILRPDLTIFLDLSPENCLYRLHKGRDQLELYENLAFLRKVREKYFEAFNLLQDQEYILIIDGNAKPDNIARKIWSSISNILSI